MLDYRLYCLDERGQIKSRKEFRARDDQSAVAMALELASGGLSELWQSGKRTATISEDGAVDYCRRTRRSVRDTVPVPRW